MSKLRSPQFGAILYRSSELISVQGAKVFDLLGISLHANKISIVLAINAKGPLSSTGISHHTGISRQLIESRLKSSVKDGFFTQMQDPQDSRKKIYDISENSKAEADRIISIMSDFEQVYAALWEEIGVDLEDGIKRMEKALSRISLEHRLCQEFPNYSDQMSQG
ncbi:MAG: MarR family winged helix-turn-helix transcriptional regulator [Litorimonas sp.]